MCTSEKLIIDNMQEKLRTVSVPEEAYENPLLQESSNLMGVH